MKQEVRKEKSSKTTTIHSCKETMGASASEMRDARRCVLCVHFMFDRDDFIYKLVRDDYLEALDEESEDEDETNEKKKDSLMNKKRIVFSHEVPFSQLPRIEGWFRNTTATECVLIAILQHFNWLIGKSKLNNAQDWETFAIDYNMHVANGSTFDGYNVEIISDKEKRDLKHSLDRIEFSMNYEVHDYKDKIPMAEQCWLDDLWTGNARDSDEWLEFLERRFDTDEIHLRCIIKTDEMDPKFFLKFMNRMMCHDGSNIVFDINKINQVKQWEEMQSSSESDTDDQDDNSKRKKKKKKKKKKQQKKQKQKQQRQEKNSNKTSKTTKKNNKQKKGIDYSKSSNDGDYDDDDYYDDNNDNNKTAPTEGEMKENDGETPKDHMIVKV